MTSSVCFAVQTRQVIGLAKGPAPGLAK